MNKQAIKLNAKRARRRIIHGIDDRPMIVNGDIHILNDKKITCISANLRECDSLTLAGCDNLASLPAGLKVQELNVSNCVSLKTLPENLEATRIIATNTGIESIPDSVTVTQELNLANCTKLTSLPENLIVTSLILSGCTALEALPDGLKVSYLDVSGCTNLTDWGENGELMETGQGYHRPMDNRSLGLTGFHAQSVNASDCAELTHLPDWMTVIKRLDVSNSPKLKQLPQHLKLTESIEVEESGLTHLPPGSYQINILWSGVIVNAIVAFNPDAITSRMVLDEPNVEARRIMIDRMGYDRFFDQLDPDLLDLDKDAGGERMLLRVPPIGWRSEAIVCLSVYCPSTQHHYMLRVPPQMQSCHQAAAWLAGFDDPALYNPLVEA